MVVIHRFYCIGILTKASLEDFASSTSVQTFESVDLCGISSLVSLRFKCGKFLAMYSMSFISSSYAYKALKTMAVRRLRESSKILLLLVDKYCIYREGGAAIRNDSSPK